MTTQYAPTNHSEATTRTKKICLFFMWVSVLNYLFHLTGFSIVSAETLQQISFIPFRVDLVRMEYSDYYRQYVDAYAGFMVIIMLLFAISTLLFAFVFLRRISVILRIVKNQELESFSWFVGVFILYTMGSYLWVFGWNSVFFNTNPKIGGNYYWFSTLLISFPWVGVLPALVIFVLEPKILGYSLFKSPQNKES